MAAHNHVPDDLIAELARLMADDARSDTPPPPSGTSSAVTPAPVRIPGGGEPQGASGPVRPTLTSALANQRIPNTPAATVATSGDADPFVQRQPATPSAPVRIEPTPPTVAATPVAAEDFPDLDVDSIADLIAAELANETLSAKPTPMAPGPAQDDDNFGVSPVFGLGTTSADPVKPSAGAVTIVEPEPVVALPPQPKGEAQKPAPVVSDPLRDIEQLVAPAIAPKPAAAATPSPALRSLATPTLPTHAPQSPKPTPAAKSGSVDEAILAAAAATGARIEWVEPENEPPAAEPRPRAAAREPRRGRVFGLSRAVAGPLLALGLLLIGGVGLYWVLGQGATPTGPAPLIVADTAAVKEVPEPVEEPAPQSVVFNEISGTDTGAEEQIVSRDQADEEAVTEAATAATEAATAATVATALTTEDVGTPDLGTGQVIPDAETAGLDPNSEGLVNRRVRTVTVRPDGTIVSSDDSLAGASILPVDRPNVPDVPGDEIQSPGLLADTPPATEPGAEPETETEIAALTPETAAEPVEPATPAVPAFEPGSEIPVVDATGTAIPGRSVFTPVQRPADFAQLSTAAIDAAAAAPAQETTPTAAATAAVPAGGTAGAYVQLSSQRTEEAARESAQAAATRFGPLFGGASLQIQQVDLGERGIYYRVLVPAADRSGANNICVNVRAAGGDCLIL